MNPIHPEENPAEKALSSVRHKLLSCKPGQKELELRKKIPELGSTNTSSLKGKAHLLESETESDRSTSIDSDGGLSSEGSSTVDLMSKKPLAMGLSEDLASQEEIGSLRSGIENIESSLLKLKTTLPGDLYINIRETINVTALKGNLDKVTNERSLNKREFLEVQSALNYLRSFVEQIGNIFCIAMPVVDNLAKDKTKNPNNVLANFLSIGITIGVTGFLVSRLAPTEMIKNMAGSFLFNLLGVAYKDNVRDLARNIVSMTTVTFAAAASSMCSQLMSLFSTSTQEHPVITKEESGFLKGKIDYLLAKISTQVNLYDKTGPLAKIQEDLEAMKSRVEQATDKQGILLDLEFKGYAIDLAIMSQKTRPFTAEEESVQAELLENCLAIPIKLQAFLSSTEGLQNPT